MGIKEEFYEQYDDILFKAVMSQVAKEQGKRLIEENERLKDDPSFEVWEKSYKHGLQTIRGVFRKGTREVKTKKMGRLVYRIAVAVMILVIFTAVAFAAFPDFRADFVNMFLNIYETHTDFTFTPETKESNEDLQITTLWFPNGFELVEKNETSLEYWEIWRKGNSMITLRKSMIQIQHIDTENARVDPILIQSYSGSIITKPCVCRIIWLNTDNGIVYYASGEEVEEQTIITIANSMH